MKDYLDFSRTASIVLAIIPITSLIFGIVVRFEEGNSTAGIVRLLIVLFTCGIGAFILWILDLVSMIQTGRIIRVVGEENK